MEVLSEHFMKFWKQNAFPSRDSSILLAVSGGLDSVVMTRLFFEAGFSCAIAHCNFQLRGKDSDDDEEFVRQLAMHYNFHFFSTRFDTSTFAKDNSISIQMAARHLRYRWFDELVHEHKFKAVAVAHHSDDVAETLLLNLIRSTGLAGMHGIRPVAKRIIRPVLFATRHEIEQYAADQHLHWREDASNADTYYLRNKIRHEVIPVLRKLNPDISNSLVHHAALMDGYESLLAGHLAELEKRMVSTRYDGAVKIIDLEALKSSPAPHILLYHFLKRYGINAAICAEILNSTITGAEFNLKNSKLSREREELVLTQTNFPDDNQYSIGVNQEELTLKFGNLQLQRIKDVDFKSLQLLPDFTDGNTCHVDASGIKFPLTIRKWQKGDYFHPLGMKGRKLVSDYFTDAKFSGWMKEMVYLLLSGDEVVWIMGHRPDDRFKITESTQSCLRLKFTPNQ